MAYKQKSDKNACGTQAESRKDHIRHHRHGRFGLALAQELHAADADLIIVDKDEEKINLARELTENAFIVRNLEKKTLLDAGMGNCDVAVVGIGEHIDTSILTTLTLVSMGIPKVIAKATSTEHGLILEKLGAEVVYPERDMAIRLAHRLETSQSLDFVQLSEKINISKFALPAQAVGLFVHQVAQRDDRHAQQEVENFGGLTIVAVVDAADFQKEYQRDERQQRRVEDRQAEAMV